MDNRYIGNDLTDPNRVIDRLLSDLFAFFAGLFAPIGDLFKKLF